MPDVVGERMADARAEVEALGLEVRNTGGGALVDPSWMGGEPRYVSDQTPHDGTAVPVDATVTLDP